MDNNGADSSKEALDHIWLNFHDKPLKDQLIQIKDLDFPPPRRVHIEVDGRVHERHVAELCAPRANTSSPPKISSYIPWDPLTMTNLEASPCTSTRVQTIDEMTTAEKEDRGEGMDHY